MVNIVTKINRARTGIREMDSCEHQNSFEVALFDVAYGALEVRKGCVMVSPAYKSILKCLLDSSGKFAEVKCSESKYHMKKKRIVEGCLRYCYG